MPTPTTFTQLTQIVTRLDVKTIIGEGDQAANPVRIRRRPFCGNVRAGEGAL